jgi:hypothetical protein
MGPCALSSPSVFIYEAVSRSLYHAKHASRSLALLLCADGSTFARSLAAQVPHVSRTVSPCPTHEAVIDGRCSEGGLRVIAVHCIPRCRPQPAYQVPVVPLPRMCARRPPPRRRFWFASHIPERQPPPPNRRAEQPGPRRGTTEDIPEA